MIIDL